MDSLKYNRTSLFFDCLLFCSLQHTPYSPQQVREASAPSVNNGDTTMELRLQPIHGMIRNSTRLKRFLFQTHLSRPPPLSLRSRWPDRRCCSGSKPGMTLAEEQKRTTTNRSHVRTKNRSHRSAYSLPNQQELHDAWRRSSGTSASVNLGAIDLHSGFVDFDEWIPGQSQSQIIDNFARIARSLC